MLIEGQDVDDVRRVLLRMARISSGALATLGVVAQAKYWDGWYDEVVDVALRSVFLSRQASSQVRADCLDFARLALQRGGGEISPMIDTVVRALLPGIADESSVTSMRVVWLAHDLVCNVDLHSSAPLVDVARRALLQAATDSRVEVRASVMQVRNALDPTAHGQLISELGELLADDSYALVHRIRRVGRLLKKGSSA